MQRLLIASALLFTACGSSANRSSNPSSAMFSDDVTCKEEVPTGTAMPRKICRSEAQRDDERRAAREMLLDPRNQKH